VSAVPVTVSLPLPVFDAVDRGVRGRLRAEVAALFGELAPGTRPELRVQAADELQGLEVQVDVAGRTCPVPVDAVPEALAYVEGRPVGPGPPEPAEALTRLVAHTDGGRGRHVLGEFLALLCRVALAGRPERIVSATGAGDLPAAPGATDDTVTVTVEPYYLRRLTSMPDIQTGFPTARRQLFDDLGVALPSLRLRPDATLRKCGFAVEVRGVRALPRVGLEPGEALIDDTEAARFFRPITGTAALHPADGRPALIVSPENRETLELWSAPLVDCLGYLVLAVVATVRRELHRTVDDATAELMLLQLHGAAPGLPAVAERVLPMPVLASVLRGLLREQVSVLNLRRIVELLLRHETTTDGNGGDVGDVDEERLARVRVGLRDQLGAAVAKGAVTLAAHALDPELAQAVAAEARPGGTHPPTGATTRLVAAARAERDRNPQVSVVVTQPQHRPAVRDALHPYLPTLTVLSVDEVPPQLGVVIAARLS